MEFNFHFQDSASSRVSKKKHLLLYDNNNEHSVCRQRAAFGLSVSFPTENDYWQFILFVFCILYPQGNREIFY